MNSQVAQVVRDWFDYILGTAQVVGTLATALAFWVTFLTLRELRRQTALANNPILKIRFRWLPVTVSDVASSIGPTTLLEHLDPKPHEKWLSIISANLQQDLSGLTNRFLTLELSNAGKSEITQVSCTLELKVTMFASDTIDFITPSDFAWKKSISVDLGEKEIVLVPITNTRYFPIHSCRITKVQYKDVRGNTYSEYDGPRDTEQIANEVLRPRVSGSKLPDAALK